MTKTPDSQDLDIKQQQQRWLFLQGLRRIQKEVQRIEHEEKRRNWTRLPAVILTLALIIFLVWLLQHPDIVRSLSAWLLG